MRRRTVFLLVAISLLLVGGLGAGLVLLIYHEPGFYRRCAIPPGPQRIKWANECMGRFVALYNYIKDWDSKEEWAVQISEAQLNSYFAEKFQEWPEASQLQRHGMTDPRIVFEEDKIRLAFRYGNKPWQSIISFDIRVWLAPKDLNVVAVEILGRHAGSLPVSVQSILEAISEQAGGQHGNVEVTWYRHNGNPVALVRFQCDKSRPTFQLRRIALTKGMITIGGLSREPGAQAQLTPAPQAQAD